MKALLQLRYGGPEALSLRDHPDPEPGPGQVRVRVARAGLNFADISARLGFYPDAPKPPVVMGYEVSGTIDKVGAGVTELCVGDSVLALTRFGGHAERAVARAVHTFKIPPGMSLDAAAALPVSYLTAFHALLRVGSLRPGERVLIHMAAGGVGWAAVQLARTVPGVEIFGTASAAKHTRLRELGVDHPIDYRTASYEKEVSRLTGGAGVHLVLNPLGGRDWSRSYRLLRPAGRMVLYGWSNLVAGPGRNLLHVAKELVGLKRFSALELMNDNRGVLGVNLGRLWEEEALLREEMDTLLKLFAQGAVSPRVDRLFPLSEGAEAHRYLQSRQSVGKVLFDCT